ncbi:Uncharacterized protein PECH_007919 [Penicillium ucsense]|uniref:Uncharacterized protein n=1 Tax=Penicillium ucsense TaxID=2839758 RepID=A0A8J8W390_9EURO|nr:Uncharacterized protein PECM_007067 [Penicillium ucsense]KAF7734552.1 Uncharacterized protein PECH_007919 [Penicillium ucsense]
MAYNAVAQIDEVVSGSDSDSDVSCAPSPVHEALNHPPNADPHLDAPLEAASSHEQPSLGRLGSMIRSMTTTSYDVVEADDYDADLSPPSPIQQQQPPPQQSARQSIHSSDPLRRIPPLNTAIARPSSSPEPPLRSASSDLPINHPIPDLQSSQGAYVGNVARLEESAERLSSSSADIGSEIRKMDQEQKRRSCSSATNSINLRNGAFSPMTQASHGSTFSARQRSVSGASRLAQLPEPEHDEDGHQVIDPPLPSSSNGPGPSHLSYAPEQHEAYQPQYTHEDGEPEQLDRPASAASGDTFQQARTLFTDFDGVHFTPLDRGNSMRRMSLRQPPLASKPQPYKEPQMGQNMVYYPAPVPRMLNLPPKLSRKPIADREKRRTELLTSIVAEDRKSALWLPGSDQPPPPRAGSHEQDQRQSKIPAHLRANLFFDKPSTTLEVDVKQHSAVATLDSILDASAHAPVSAFTDHPYAGHVGSQVFSQSKRQTLYTNPAEQAGHRTSRISMGHRLSVHPRPQTGDQQATGAPRDDRAYPDQDHRAGESSDGKSDYDDDEEGHSLASGPHEEEDREFVEFVGPPNTLLAELDLRKHELRQRQKVFVPTASQAMGMHSTLLEMDAMAQRQSDKRRRRPVTLAWNNRDTVDDEDVPLAMLYADQAPGAVEERPLGLMERRQLEETEPLSTRRARLRGEPVPEKRPMYHEAEVRSSDANNPAGNSEDEGETLAERMKRLRGQNPAENDFASEVLAEINSKAEAAPQKAEPAPATKPTLENETLAQRRLRLQRENGPPRGNHARDLHTRRSMAALPHTRHAQHASLARHASHDVLPYGNTVPGQYAGRMSTQSLLLNPNQQAYGGYPMTQQQQAPYVYPSMNYPAAQAYNSMMMGVPGGMTYAMPAGCGPNMTQQPVEPAQQEFIDRWRQSIR